MSAGAPAPKLHAGPRPHGSGRHMSLGQSCVKCQQPCTILRRKGPDGERVRGGILGLGLLMGGAVFSYGRSCRCHKAEILAIRDEGALAACLALCLARLLTGVSLCFRMTCTPWIVQLPARHCTVWLVTVTTEGLHVLTSRRCGRCVAQAAGAVLQLLWVPARARGRRQRPARPARPPGLGRRRHAHGALPPLVPD